MYTIQRPFPWKEGLQCPGPTPSVQEKLDWRFEIGGWSARAQPLIELAAMDMSPTVRVQNTFLSEFRGTGATRRTQSAEPTSPVDRYALQMHALMYRTRPLDAPPKVPAGPGEAEAEAEAGAARSADSTAANSDAEDDMSEVSQRTGSSGTATTSSAAAGNAEEVEDGIEALLKQESLESLLQRVPLDSQGIPTSIGSILHNEGTCKACVFAHNDRKACQNGVQCKFCHFNHPPKRRLRFGKKKRMEMKRLEDALVGGA